MSVVLRPMEIVQRNVAIGVRFWDIAGATSAIDGLTVELFPRHNPAARKPMLPNRSGIYVAHAVSGLRPFEFDASDPVEQPWTNATRSPMAGYRVEVRDESGRFLPTAFDADLPLHELLSLTAPWLSPPQALVLPGEAGSPPQQLIKRVPLFSTPSRPIVQPLAAVHAQLRDLAGSRVPAWALLAANIDGELRGLGQADEQGRVTVMFPYPEPQRTPLASPPEARNDFGWTVELSAYWSAASLPARANQLPDLLAVLSQLDTPVTVIDSVGSPASPRRLDYRVPLTARTEGLPAADASYLMLTA